MKTIEKKVPLAVGSMRNQCPSCGLLFGGLTRFDKHRTGAFGTPSGRRCMSPAELEKLGLKEGPDGFWSRPGASDARDCPCGLTGSAGKLANRG